MSREWCEFYAIYFFRLLHRQLNLLDLFLCICYAFQKILLRMQNRRKFLIVEVFGGYSFGGMI